jgi:AcrR family transcriptional regulator
MFATRVVVVTTQRAPGLRERKKQQTREALSWAALRLAVERGYGNVLVEDIAAEAGVSPRTFNNYFAGKAEAAASRHLDRCLRVADALREQPADEPLWAAIAQAVIAQFVAGPEVIANPVAEPQAWVAGLRLMVAVPAIQAETLRASSMAESALAEAVAERTGTDPRTDLYPRLVAAAVMAASNVATQVFLAGRDNRGEAYMHDLLLDALRQLVAGLPPPTSRNP